MDVEKMLASLFNCCQGGPDFTSPLDHKLARVDEKEEKLRKQLTALLNEEQSACYEAWQETAREMRRIEALVDFAEGLDFGAQLARLLG